MCKEVGSPVSPDYNVSVQLTREELDQIVYPVVVKPIDCSANRGMIVRMKKSYRLLLIR